MPQAVAVLVKANPGAERALEDDVNSALPLANDGALTILYSALLCSHKDFLPNLLPQLQGAKRTLLIR
jgi:hypothetical protein